MTLTAVVVDMTKPPPDRDRPGTTQFGEDMGNSPGTGCPGSRPTAGRQTVRPRTWIWPEVAERRYS